METGDFLKKLFEKAGRAGFEACEAYLSQGDSFEAEVFGGEVIGYSVSRTRGLGFRALYEGKMGYAATEALDEQAVDQLIDGAKTAAKLIDSHDRQFLSEGGGDYPSLQLFNPKLDQVSETEKLNMALELEKKTLAQDARIAQVTGCGLFSVSATRRIVNSLGLDVSFSDNALGAYVMPLAKEGERTGTAFAARTVRDAAALDIDAIAGQAAREALCMLQARSLPSGRYPIVLRRDAARKLLGAFGGVFSAERAQRGLSLLAGREGETVAAQAVTLIDDPLLPDGFASTPFDAEGTPAMRKQIIAQGRLNTLMHNLKTANKAGVASTGNACRASYAAPISVAPTNLYIQSGGLTLEELARRAGDGVMITELEGLHAGADSVSGDFSLSAKGYLIRQGRACGAVEQITLSGNFFQLLKDIEGVGGDLEFGMPGVSCVGSPSLLVRALSVAGK